MSTTPVPAQAAPLSQGARIVNTYIAPSKTFNDLQRSASWWAPWLLSCVCALLFCYSIGQYVGWDQVSRNSIAQTPKRAEQIDKLPPDQKAKQLQIAATATKYFSYAIPLIVVIAFLIMGSILMATFNLALGAAVPFRVSLAIVAYGGLPGIIGSLLATISVVAGGMTGSLDPAAFDIRNPVATNLSYFMDPMGNKFLYGMASALDVFVIWSIILMGIGFACNSKIKKGTAIGTVAGWYLVWKLLTAGLAAAFS